MSFDLENIGKIMTEEYKLYTNLNKEFKSLKFILYTLYITRSILIVVENKTDVFIFTCLIYNSLYSEKKIIIGDRIYIN